MIFELFSHRKKRLENAGAEDVYQYVNIPTKLRVQVQQILRDSIGPHYRISGYSSGSYAHNPSAWNFIQKALCKELGKHYLTSPHSLAGEDVIEFINKAETEEFLDAVELSIRYVDKVIGDIPDYQRPRLGIEQSREDALIELNYRFREASVGFQYEDGQIIRVDAEFLHEEMIKPALRLLSGKEFSGAQQEFLQAHTYYRAGEYSQSITESAKAFESTLKAACDIKKWPYEKGARASDLLKTVRAHGLWPNFLDNSFDQLVATLASGLPKVRNEQGAHGQGGEIRIVPDYVAAYALHLAAAKIRLISEAAQA